MNTLKKKENVLADTRNIIKKYPDRIPVLLKSKDLLLDKHKYLIPKDLTLSQFIYVIRKRARNVDSKTALFVLINDIIPGGMEPMSRLYERHVDPDTELLIVYIQKENTFGSKKN